MSAVVDELARSVMVACLIALAALRGLRRLGR